MTETWAQIVDFEGIIFDNLDGEFTQKIKNTTGGKDLTACFQCAKCSSGCPVADKAKIQVHEMMRMVLFGLEEVLRTDMLWLCTTCFNCQERCPQEANPTEVIIAVRNVAAEAGYMLEPHKKVSEKLLDAGHAVPIDEKNMNMRDELGIGRLPPTVHSHEKALEQVKEILKKSGFKKLIKGEE